MLAAMLTMVGVSPLSAQGNDKEPDLQALYQEIDDAIEHSPQYIAHRLGQIDDLHKLLLDESSLEKRLTLAFVYGGLTAVIIAPQSDKRRKKTPEILAKWAKWPAAKHGSGR